MTLTSVSDYGGAFSLAWLLLVPGTNSKYTQYFSVDWLVNVVKYFSKENVVKLNEVNMIYIF